MGLFRKIFKIKPKKFLGIDMGTSSLRVVELGRRGKKIWLENYGEAPLEIPDSFSEAGEKFLAPEKETADILVKICKAAKINTKDASIAVPDFFSFYVAFNLPTMARDEIIQAVEYEVRPHIPLPLSEITLDWMITEGEPSKTPLKILVVAVPNNIIHYYREIANLAGLRLKTIEPEVFGLTRALIGQEDEKEIIGLIDFGAKSTTCNIVEKGVLKMSHSFRIGGTEFTNTLVRSLNIGYNEAEKAKREEGIRKDGKTKELLLPVVDSALEEIKKVFRDYFKKEGKKVEKIIIFGSSALLPGLAEYLKSQLGKEIENADPFKNISFPSSLGNLSQKRKMSLAIPIGVAIKELRK
ncbi:MAG: type IV pilus assembly protein PilM [Candidatus Paceibacterota bacterium]|jgi:type IV pilus assembly protein PilM|nr:type IV pilus assembly protein PilM [Candidatus Paceibacterota bacterium]MDD3072631.1 type IV pilus assembly protein PilM [Candidatus Paceibacterota bacterium]MDD4201679.1 type IV pilus assembly protein PilM [Candidatus Paceibacterota bacterium]MDD4467027.1 type IV pilus assembly protein PilM [Candidatus Paceibacterota bacterium]MDD4897500.1 type IV pilus assembly protein PilM [Candidatus Paceibacterota bacterium]